MLHRGLGAEPLLQMLLPFPNRGRTVPESEVRGVKKGGSLVHSFIFKHLLSTYYVLGTGETEEYKHDSSRSPNISHMKFMGY